MFLHAILSCLYLAQGEESLGSKLSPISEQT
jgi:hypothetical protein